MYFTSLPDHSKPGFDEQMHFDRFKHHNMIFHATAHKSYCDHHVGCLSIKTVFNGEEWYEVGKRQLAVRPGHYLVLNDDQDYSYRMDSSENVNTLSVFFEKTFASAVFRDALVDEETLLDNPFDSGELMLEFFQQLNPIDQALEQKLAHLVSTLNKNGYDENIATDHLLFLLHHLVHLHRVDVACISKVKAVKPGTRSEIYRRLCLAKDFLHSTFTDSPDIAAVSNASCLSTPQLIRQFKAAFLLTPHQYLVRIKLAYAAKLLQQTDASVYDIAWKSGFEDASAFCRAFKAEYRATPICYRNRN